jgi:hypothetical protein
MSIVAKKKGFIVVCLMFTAANCTEKQEMVIHEGASPFTPLGLCII